MKRFEGFQKGVNLGGWISQYYRRDEEYFNTFITEEDIEEIAALGFDHVRVPVDYNVLEDEEGNVLEAGFKHLEDCRRWCADRGLNMLIDLHECYGYSFDPLKKDMDRERFFYDKDLQELLHKTADDLGIELEDGVYLQITGPAYETPNEVAMYALLGADAVGMSTGCEGVALKHMGMRIMGITCITDMAIVNTTFETSHEEIQKVANRAGKELQKLVKEVVRRIGA